MKNSLKKNCQKNIFIKKNSMKKKKFGQKNFSGNFLKFRNFLKFLSLDIFQRLCENVSHI